MSRWRRPPSDRGLALIEVICALIVLAIGITAAFRMIGDQSRQVLSEQDRVISHWVALNALESRRMAGLSSPPVVEMGGIAWQVEEQLEPGPLGLTRVRVRASASNHAGAVVTSYLAPPDEDMAE